MVQIFARQTAMIAMINHSLSRRRFYVFCYCFDASSYFVYSYYSHLDFVASSTNNNCCAN
jgi:hypothetical protein